MNKVLLIDDDVELTTLLQEYLVEEGYDVVTGTDAGTAIAAAARNSVDLIVLDIMMPRMTGIEILQRIRKLSQVPVLMLTARGDDVDRISGLNLGADDYVTKPCSPGELAARVRAILRRANQRAACAATDTLRAGRLVVHPGSRTAEWKGQPLVLTGTEFGLLEVLARNAGQLVSKQEISKRAFGKPLTPFEGVVRDGKVYGRGACDMKGGLAASIIAAEAFLEVYPDFAGSIEISGTVDEESGGFGGVAYLASKGFFSKPRVDHVIIPEPLNKDRICLGHRGVWWAEIETKGEIAHGSMPFLGDCAVRHMGAVLDAFEKELFPALDRKQTRMPVVPDGAKRSTMNINSIHGGQTDDYSGLPSPNVPDSCRLTIDRRFLLEEDIAEVKREVTSILDRLQWERPKFHYNIRDIMEVQPLMTERDAPVVTAVAQGIRDVFGKEPEYVISPGTYDQKHIARIGLLHDCIAYGPGILDLAHRPDEYVGIEDMVESAKVMALGLKVLLSGSI